MGYRGLDVAGLYVHERDRTSTQLPVRHERGEGQFSRGETERLRRIMRLMLCLFICKSLYMQEPRTGQSKDLVEVEKVTGTFTCLVLASFQAI